MRIREYEPSDWPQLCEIHDEARRQELEASGLLEAFLTLEQTAEGEGLFDGKVYVAEAEGVPVGFIAIAEGEITWLYVSPRHQRCGIARRLVREAIACAGGPVSLDVLEGNEAALKLYLSEGFEVVKRVSGRLAGNEAFAATGLVLRHHGVA
ncbi:GNAT family N-acetyltransferase [Nodosilinea sp. LEGE 06152]|uniref:GNAT family N-acetyltransferase n=1 Tax=Nodosilinea sp. LEGE 06152 TaxID=2777966 RepID=UPI001883040C|nr:N-acetyltransferase [Nodosilinea sp. LEGE 06152]MBE9157059.1 GNAT family N-acetyltransferase [Nodosilinea sp. LEGE 06152]